MFQVMDLARSLMCQSINSQSNFKESGTLEGAEIKLQGLYK